MRPQHPGLDINEQEIKLLILAPSSERAKIHAQHSLPISALDQLRQYKFQSVNIQIPNSQTITSFLETSTTLSDRDIEAQIKLELPNLFPNTPKDLYFDFTTISFNEAKNTQRLLIVASHRPLLDEKILALKKAGIRIQSIEPHGYAQQRCLQYLEPDRKEPLILVELHLQHFELILIDQWMVAHQQSRFHPELMSEEIIHAIQLLLASSDTEPTRIVLCGDETKYSMLRETLQEKLNRPCTWMNLSSLALDSSWSTALGLALKDLLDVKKKTVNDSLKNTKNKMANSRGLTMEPTKKSVIPAKAGIQEFFKPLNQHISNKDWIPAFAGMTSKMAIFETSPNINLLPWRTQHRQQIYKKQILMVIAGLAACLLYIAGIAMHYRHKTQTLNNHIQNLQAQETPLQPQLKKFKILLTERKEWIEKMQSLQKTQGINQATIEQLIKLGNASNPGITLKSITKKDQHITLVGRSEKPTQLQHYITVLKETFDAEPQDIHAFHFTILLSEKKPNAT